MNDIIGKGNIGRTISPQCRKLIVLELKTDKGDIGGIIIGEGAAGAVAATAAGTALGRSAVDNGRAISVRRVKRPGLSAIV